MFVRKTELDPKEIVTRHNFKHFISERKNKLAFKIEENKKKYELKESNASYPKKIKEKKNIEFLKKVDLYNILPDVKRGDSIIDENKIDPRIVYVAQHILELDLNKALIYQKINWAKNLHEMHYTSSHAIPEIGEKGLCAGFKKNRAPCQKKRTFAHQSNLKQVALECYCDCLVEEENARRNAVREQTGKYLEEKLSTYSKILEKAKEEDKAKKETLLCDEIKEWHPIKKQLMSTQAKIETLSNFITKEKSKIDFFKEGIVKVKALQPSPLYNPDLSHPANKITENVYNEPGMLPVSCAPDKQPIHASAFPKTNHLLEAIVKEICRLYRDDSWVLSSGADKAYYIMDQLAFFLTGLEDGQQEYNDETLYDKIKTACQETGDLYPFLRKKRNEKFDCKIFSNSFTKTELAINKAIYEIDHPVKDCTNPNLEAVHRRHPFAWLPRHGRS